MEPDRRTFIRLGLGAAVGSLMSYGFLRGPQANGIKLGTFFQPNPTADDFAFLKNSGVEYVSVWTSIQDNSLDFMTQTRRRFEAHGIQGHGLEMGG